jgi:predicted O-linked N-acetylglucosamine transferase (SPINDLY family)
MIDHQPPDLVSVGPLWQRLKLNPADGALWLQISRAYGQALLSWQAGYGARQFSRINPGSSQDVDDVFALFKSRKDFDADAVLALAPGGCHAERIVQFVEWLGDDPGDWLTWLYLARLLELEPLEWHHSDWPTPQVALQRAITFEPMIGESQHWLGVWRLNSGDVSGSVASFSELLNIRPVRFGSMMFLGEALLRHGQRAAAEKAFSRASLSNNPVFLRDLAQRVYRHNYWNEALDILNKTLQIQPDSVVTLLAMANIHWEVYNLADVRKLCQRILALDPDNGDVGYMLSALPGRMGDAKGHFAAVLEKYDQVQDPTSRLASSIAMASLYQDDLSPQAIADLHRQLVKPIEAALGRAPSCFPVPCRGDRLRIGLVSGDFHRQHPVNLFMLPILQRLDHSKYEIFVYHTGSMQDEYTLMARSCADTWIESSKLDDRALLEQIRSDAIQILLDLAGHTSSHRLGLFTLRAAPVQATFLGYPHSTGLSSIDWLIGDRWVSPAEHQGLFSEGLAQLPGCVFCWSPVDGYPLPFPRASDAPVVFGSFNNVMKLTPHTLRLWSQILHAVPGSKLFLKAPSLRDGAVCDRFRRLFADHHIDPTRLEFQGPTELSTMMQCYGKIDIALDPVPYNGGTTSLQALWMGVPLVSLLGGNFVSRMGGSFLHALGRSEWLALDDDDYVRIASELAVQVSELRQRRQQFRDQMAVSPLSNIDLYVLNFQGLLERMWLAHQEATGERLLVLDPI